MEFFDRVLDFPVLQQKPRDKAEDNEPHPLGHPDNAEKNLNSARTHPIHIPLAVKIAVPVNFKGDHDALETDFARHQ